MAVDTRTRIIAATAELFRRQGLTGTGLKQIAHAAQAPFSSIYHFFPGGKTDLADEVIRRAGALYGEHVLTIFDACADLPAAIEVAFATAAKVMVESDYVDACPIETIALEVASTDETLRRATADVFTGWIDSGTAHIEQCGLSHGVRRRLIIGFISSLEGAFVLSRSLRSTEPLEAASRMMQLAVRAELAHGPSERTDA